MNYYLFEHDSIKVNMVFEEIEIERFVEMWEDGYSVLTISYVLNRTPLEIALLTMDRAETGFINRRKFGINGY